MAMLMPRRRLLRFAAAIWLLARGAHPAAAREAKVDHYFIEQDSTPGDPLDSIRTSVKYLREMSF